MHAVINRELEILRSAGSDGDSAWRRTGNLPVEPIVAAIRSAIGKPGWLARETHLRQVGFVTAPSVVSLLSVRESV